MILVLVACAVFGLIVPTSLQAQSRIIQDIPCKASPRTENDLPARVEETNYFVDTMKAAGHENVRLLQICDRDHGSVAARIAEEDDPALRDILEFVRGL